MKTLMKSIVVAALCAGVSSIAVAAPARPAAPVTGGTTAGVNGIAVANLDAVVVNSNAFKAAQAQRDTTYKPQLDQAKAREAALNGQLKGLVDKFQKDRAANAPQATLAPEYAQIQQLQEQGKAELEKILEPVRLSDAYVLEQMMDKRSAAVQAAMTKSGVTLLLTPEAVQAAANSYNLNQAILTELNALVPSVQIVPPAGWVPREVREAQAANGGAAPAPAGGGR